MTGRGNRLLRIGVTGALVGLVALCTIVPAQGYVKFGVTISGRDVVVRWPSMPVRYSVRDSGVPGVSAADLDAALGRALQTWRGVSEARTSFERLGFTSARPSEDDGLTVLGFETRPDLQRVLGQTSYTFDLLRGEILEADVTFNAAQLWSVAPGGSAGRFDLESIALHEVGHLLGLGHSAIGETELGADGQRRLLSAGSIMFPIAFSAGSIEGRTLRADDIAGVSDIYPTDEFRRERGSISGRITKNGQGIFGAHIVVFNLSTGQLVGGYSLNPNGDFVIAGLDPGAAVVRVEPLDDGDRESFFEESAPIDLAFGVTFAERVVTVPRGGNIDGVDVAVRAR